MTKPVSAAALLAAIVAAVLSLLIVNHRNVAAVPIPSPAGSTASRDATSIEFADALRVFMLPAAVTYNVPGWDIGATDVDPAAINWQTDGRADDPRGVYLRHADAIIAIDGHVMKTLRRRETAMKWSIDLYGPNGFPSIVDIAPGLIQESQSIVDYLRRHGYKLNLRECHEPAGFQGTMYQEALYTISAPKLQSATFYVLYSQGASHVMYDYQLRYGVEDVSLSDFRDADPLPLQAKSKCPE